METGVHLSRTHRTELTSWHLSKTQARTKHERHFDRSGGQHPGEGMGTQAHLWLRMRLATSLPAWVYKLGLRILATHCCLTVSKSVYGRFGQLEQEKVTNP